MLLLQAASQNRTDLTLADFRAEQIRWAVETGLGPLLRRATANDPTARTSPLWPFLRGADLTARLIVGEQMDAMDEIIRTCEGQTPPLTLLKGISIGEQHYPEPHLRLMGDIDVLVDQGIIRTVESLLLRLGYCRYSENPPAFYDTHHHLTPLFHPGKRVWVEIHRGLFPADSPVASDRVFGLENLRRELRLSEFRGRPVNRLSDELQVVYLASHWAFGFSRVRGMVGMLDLIYLLKKAPGLRWERILDWLDGSIAATYVYVLLRGQRRRVRPTRQRPELRYPVEDPPLTGTAGSKCLARPLEAAALTGLVYEASDRLSPASQVTKASEKREHGQEAKSNSVGGKDSKHTEERPRTRSPLAPP